MTDRGLEFKSACRLARKKLGAPAAADEPRAGAPALHQSLAARQSSAIAAKLSEIDGRLANLRAAAERKHDGGANAFERAMAAVERDCAWADKGIAAILAAADGKRGQRRDHERVIAATLRAATRGSAAAAPAAAAAPPGAFAPSSSFAPSGLRARRPGAAAGAAAETQSRLQLQQEQQRQQMMLEQASRRRLDTAHNIEKEIGKLGERLRASSSSPSRPRSSSLDDDAEGAPARSRWATRTPQGAGVVRGNRALFLKVFAVLIALIVLFVLF
ncbi:hypothetical protein JL722_12150 [Aureococcus anophagefferens]|nr:hypothetical protein JL722_12150 [Aureococcus anophagefferens]